MAGPWLAGKEKEGFYQGRTRKGYRTYEDNNIGFCVYRIL